MYSPGESQDHTGQKGQKQSIHPGFKTHGRSHHKSKTGISVSPQKGFVSSKIFFKKKPSRGVLFYISDSLVSLYNYLCKQKTFFFEKFLEDVRPFHRSHWYPCFGLLVTSALGFKARVDPFCVLSRLCDPQNHLLCDTCWRQLWCTHIARHCPIKKKLQKKLRRWSHCTHFIGICIGLGQCEWTIRLDTWIASYRNHVIEEHCSKFVYWSWKMRSEIHDL